MKTIKKMICVLLALLTVGSLCACGMDSSSNGTSKTEITPEQQVRSIVESRGMTQYIGSAIGGNELKSSRATVTNVKYVSFTEYVVSGKIVMTDIYGTNWNNTFDCKVKKSGNIWSAGSFEYTSKNWTKG